MRIRVISPSGRVGPRLSSVQAISVGGSNKDNELILLPKSGGAPIRYPEEEWIKVEIEREMFGS